MSKMATYRGQRAPLSPFQRSLLRILGSALIGAALGALFFYGVTG